MLKITKKNRKWWILFAMTSTLSMIFIDITVLPVALPTIQRQLDLSDLSLQWIINAYTLTLSVLVLAGGKLGDILGHRRIFCWGLFLFSIASALCGLSTSGWWFILSRVIQGVGGAFLIPSTSAINIASFPINQRGKAMGLYVGIASLFLALGPFIGGIFTEYFTWRLVFWINLPIALVGFVLALLSVPKSKTKQTSFDFFGFFTMSLGITSLIIPLMQAKNWGWLSPLTMGLFVFGILLIALLVIFDRAISDPFIDFKIFKNKQFIGPIFTIFFTQFLIMITVFWAIYFQTALGYTPLETGILSLISNAPIILIAPFGGYLLDRFGPRIPICSGFLLVILSLIWFLQILPYKNTPLLLSAILPFGCGIPLIFTPSFTSAMNEVSEHKRGVAAGISTMLRQFGATVGLAIFGALFLSVQHSHFSTCLNQRPETAPTHPLQFEGILSNSPPALQALSQFPKEIQTFIKNCYLSSYIHSFWIMNLLAILIGCIGLIWSFYLLKKKPLSKE